MYRESSRRKGKLALWCHCSEMTITNSTFIRLSSLSRTGCRGKSLIGKRQRSLWSEIKASDFSLLHPQRRVLLALIVLTELQSFDEEAVGSWGSRKGWGPLGD